MRDTHPLLCVPSCGAQGQLYVWDLRLCAILRRRTVRQVLDFSRQCSCLVFYGDRRHIPEKGGPNLNPCEYLKTGELADLILSVPRIVTLNIHTPTNAHNLCEIINYPYTWTLLRVSAINHHPQGDTVQRQTQPAKCYSGSHKDKMCILFLPHCGIKLTDVPLLILYVAVQYIQYRSIQSCVKFILWWHWESRAPA